jgi:hypothetical protein
MGIMLNDSRLDGWILPIACAYLPLIEREIIADVRIDSSVGFRLHAAAANAGMGVGMIPPAFNGDVAYSDPAYGKRDRNGIDGGWLNVSSAMISETTGLGIALNSGTTNGKVPAGASEDTYRQSCARGAVYPTG